MKPNPQIALSKFGTQQKQFFDVCILICRYKTILLNNSARVIDESFFMKNKLWLAKAKWLNKFNIWSLVRQSLFTRINHQLFFSTIADVLQCVSPFSPVCTLSFQRSTSAKKSILSGHNPFLLCKCFLFYFPPFHTRAGDPKSCTKWLIWLLKPKSQMVHHPPSTRLAARKETIFGN